MSFYTDWFVADEADAEDLANSESPYDEWQSLSLKSVGEIHLMTLWAILQNKEVADLRPVSAELLFEGSEEGPFVVRVAPEFITDLSKIQEPDINTLVSTWSQTEELTDWDVEELTETIRHLSVFASQAEQASKPVVTMFST